MKLTNAIHTILVGLCLLLILVGGSYLIVHNSSWSMDDACMIQAKAGSGVPMHLNDFPGFNPAEGRLFPLAYAHTNLILLFSGGRYCSAKPFYVLQAVFWMLFVLLLYDLCYSLFKEKLLSKNIAKWLALAVVLVCCQRFLPIFTCLWTTGSVGVVLIILLCFVFYKYLRSDNKRKRYIYGVVLILVLFYLTFCGEVNVIVPLVFGVGLVCITRKMDFLSVSSLLVGVLFLVLYYFLIFRYTDSFYDSSHGSTDTVFSNAIKMLLLQKLLILMFAVFLYRLFAVFIRKKPFDIFGDVLLLISVAYALGGFALRLNGYYYTLPILYGMIALIVNLDFKDVKGKLLSCSLILLVFCYHVVKYPKLCKAIYRERAEQYKDMTRFAELLVDEKDIVWFAEEFEQGNIENIYNGWARGHVVPNLKHIKKDVSFKLLDVDAMRKGMVLLCPKTTHISKLEGDFPEMVFVEKDTFCDLLVLYEIE